MSNAISEFNTQTGLYVSDNGEHPAIGTIKCNNCGGGNVPDGCLPIGSILPHYGAWVGNVSAGGATWALADGTQGTEDLRGQLIRASDPTGGGGTGGNSTSSYILTTDNIPYHKHTPLAAAGPTSFLMQQPSSNPIVGSLQPIGYSEQSTGDVDPLLTAAIQFNNDPPYLTTKFIQRIS